MVSQSLQGLVQVYYSPPFIPSLPDVSENARMIPLQLTADTEPPGAISPADSHGTTSLPQAHIFFFFLLKPAFFSLKIAHPIFFFPL